MHPLILFLLKAKLRRAVCFTPSCRPRQDARWCPSPKMALPGPEAQQPVCTAAACSASHGMISSDAIWSQIDDIRAEESDGESYSSSDEGECRRRPVMVRLPCGDVHVCGGSAPCPFLEPNEDNMLVCPYSGVEYESENCEEYFDLNGGTGKRSGDPDQTCGEPVYGKWGRRIDPVAASRMAYRNADTMEDNDISNYVHKDDAGTASAKQSSKRGALCVGEKPEQHAVKRGRISKKNVSDQASVSRGSMPVAALRTESATRGS